MFYIAFHQLSKAMSLIDEVFEIFYHQIILIANVVTPSLVARVVTFDINCYTKIYLEMKKKTSVQQTLDKFFNKQASVESSTEFN